MTEMTLHQLAAQGGGEAMARAIEAGADLAATDGERMTALHVAAAHNADPAVSRALIEAKVDLDARNEDGMTPLHCAVSHNNPQPVELLIEAGAELDAGDGGGDTPLHLAVRKGRANLVARLIQAGADAEATSERGWTPLQEARKTGAEAKIIEALQKGPEDAGEKVDEAGADAEGETRWRELFEAASGPNASADAIARLAGEGVDVNATDSEGNTALHAAARGNAPNCVRALLEHGADPAISNLIGSTALLLASKMHYHPIITIITEHEQAQAARAGADGGQENERGAEGGAAARIERDPPVAPGDDQPEARWEDLARLTGGPHASAEGIRKLVEGDGLDVNTRGEHGETALHLAVEGAAKPDIINMLARLGADLHARDKEDLTPLELARDVGHPDTVQLIEELAARQAREKAEAEGKTHAAPAERAVDAKPDGQPDQPGAQPEGGAQPPVVRQPPQFLGGFEGGGGQQGQAKPDQAERATEGKLVSVAGPWARLKAWARHPWARAAAQVEPADDRFELHRAVQQTSTRRDSVRQMIEDGAEVTLVDPAGRAPLHYAASWNEDPDVITQLVKAGADIMQRDGGCRTPLHRAVLNCNPEMAARLVELGASLQAQDARGRSPLHVALGWPQETAMIRKLLQLGADVNARDMWGRTPLHIAAALCNDIDIIRLLDQAGADLGARDGEGQTPLHAAAREAATPVIGEALHKAGADLHARDREGLTPVMLAAVDGSPGMHDYLVTLGG